MGVSTCARQRAGGFFEGFVWERRRILGCITKLWIHAPDSGNLLCNGAIERPTESMKSRGVNTAVVLLLGLVLIWPRVFTSIAGHPSIATEVAGKCCGHDCAKCASPACCTRPTQPSTPLPPGPPPSSSQNEWQALAAPIVPVSAPPSRSAHQLPPGDAWVRASKTTPLFQRDCRYLL